jgi:hypothetical protein
MVRSHVLVILNEICIFHPLNISLRIVLKEWAFRLKSILIDLILISTVSNLLASTKLDHPNKCYVYYFLITSNEWKRDIRTRILAIYVLQCFSYARSA